MSRKLYDPKQHWRCKTVSFRLSPEEHDRLNMFVAISGMPKQEYLASKVLDKSVTIQPNIRTQKHLSSYIAGMTKELERISSLEDLSAADSKTYIFENIRYLLELAENLSIK